MMENLSSPRIQPARAFINSGVDFGGHYGLIIGPVAKGLTNVIWQYSVALPLRHCILNSSWNSPLIHSLEHLSDLWLEEEDVRSSIATTQRIVLDLATIIYSNETRETI